MVKEHGDGAIKTSTQSNTGCEPDFHQELHQLHHSHLLHNLLHHSKAQPESCAAACIPNLTIESSQQFSLVADEDQNQSKLLARLALDGKLQTRQATTATNENLSITADEDRNYSKTLAEMAINGQLPNKDAITPAPDANSPFAAFEVLNLDIHATQQSPYAAFEALDRDEHPPENKWHGGLHPHNHWFHWFQK